MKILVVGTPKRDAHMGFDNLVIGLSRTDGVTVEHFPDILTRSSGFKGTYGLNFNKTGISYPGYLSVIKKIKTGDYDLLITFVCHVDYKAGRHGFLSNISRRLKYSLVSNKYKMGGTLVADWAEKGYELPPLVVFDDLDDPFIWPVDFPLLSNCLLYFKRNLPLNRFLCFRLFESSLDKEQQIRFARKLRPAWISYDSDSIAAFAGIDRTVPYEERDIDISFFCNKYTNYRRIELLPLVDSLKTRYNVATSMDGRVSRSDFFRLSGRSRISVSPGGRSWDTQKHYELLLCGGLLFIDRPSIELPFNLKDGENCVFIDDLEDFKGLVENYLGNLLLSAKIAREGYTLAKNHLNNKKLAEYVLNTAKEHISKGL